jgi:hypothetical protein
MSEVVRLSCFFGSVVGPCYRRVFLYGYIVERAKRLKVIQLDNQPH